MKTKIKQLAIMLFIIIGFTGCSKDDEEDYQIKEAYSTTVWVSNYCSDYKLYLWLTSEDTGFIEVVARDRGIYNGLIYEYNFSSRPYNDVIELLKFNYKYYDGILIFTYTHYDSYFYQQTLINKYLWEDLPIFRVTNEKIEAISPYSEIKAFSKPFYIFHTYKPGVKEYYTSIE